MFNMANVGTTDRLIFLAIGALSIVASYLHEAQLWQNAAIRWSIPAIGVVLVLTGLSRFRPLYRLNGANTFKTS